MVPLLEEGTNAPELRMKDKDLQGDRAKTRSRLHHGVNRFTQHLRGESRFPDNTDAENIWPEIERGRY